MSAVIFNGDSVKALKNKLKMKDGVQFITGDSDNPTVVAKDAPASSVYNRAGTDEVYIKQDVGSSTNWTLQAPNLYGVLREPTGVFDRALSTMTFVDVTRTLSLTTVGGYDIYFSGVKINITTTKTIVITDVEGIHFVYFDTDGALHEEVNPTDLLVSEIIRLKVPVSYIYWDATNNTAVYFGEERHGTTMDGTTHAYLHYTRGLQYINGLGLNSFVIGDGSLDSHAQFDVAAGVIADEDIYLAPTAIASTVGLPIFYRDGVGGLWRKTTQAGFSVKQAASGTARLLYNLNTAGTWSQVEIGERNYVLCHVYATTGVTSQIIAVMGIAEYATAASARAGAALEISDLQLGSLPSPEMRPIATVIFQTDKDYGNSINARIIEAVSGGDDYVDWRTSDLPRGTVATNHSSLSGLSNDDHLQYLLTTGARDVTGVMGYDTDKTFTDSKDIIAKKYVDDGLALKVDNDNYLINYIANYKAAVDTSGYLTYADTPDVAPANGSGGTPVVTFTRNTSSPLFGVADFVITKDATNRQGDGVAYDFTLASGHQGRVLTLNFDYKTSANYVSNDLRAYLYDITNNTMYTGSPALVKASSVSAKFSCTFLTSAASTSYRLILHVAGTTSNAWTVNIDNVELRACNGQFAFYQDGSGQEIIDGNTLTWDTKLIDSHNAMSSGVFTIKKSGLLTVLAGYRTAAIVLTDLQTFGAELKVNGTIVGTQQFRQTGTSSSSNWSLNMMFVYPVNVGDTCNLVFTESIGAVNMSTTTRYNFSSWVVQQC